MTARWTLAWAIIAAMVVGVAYVLAEASGGLDPIVELVTRLSS